MIEVETPACMGCGQTTWLVMTEEQYFRLQSGEHVQDIFPDWSDEDRELLITGTCPTCWDEMLPPEDEEDWYPEYDDGYLNGDESACWRDSDKDWYVD